MTATKAILTKRDLQEAVKRHVAKIRELEAELADSDKAQQMIFAQMVDEKARAEKAEARVAELEHKLRVERQFREARETESLYYCSDCGEPKEANEPDCGKAREKGKSK